MHPREVAACREQLEIKVEGFLNGEACPNPVTEFYRMNFPLWVYEIIGKRQFQRPMPVQMQIWPIAVTGRDVVGVARTGSGKTLAFLLPAFLHILAQEYLRPGDGPVVLILTPTRELALQIYEEVVELTRGSEVKSAFAVGQMDKRAQLSLLKDTPDVLVGVPGRTLDFLTSGETCLNRCSYFVLDEADRLLDMGFEKDINQIVGGLRPTCQKLMFSATWGSEVNSLARRICRSNPVKVTVGSSELKVSDNVEQVLLPVQSGRHNKMRELTACLTRIKTQMNCQKTIVFCNKKSDCNSIVEDLGRQGISACSVHGDLDQPARKKNLDAFKDTSPRAPWVMVATDVLARGLDVREVRFVINFEPPLHLEDYVHRCGRTGRVSDKGTAITLVDQSFPKLSELVELVKRSPNANIPQLIFDAVRGGSSGSAYSGGSAYSRGDTSRGGYSGRGRGGHR